MELKLFQISFIILKSFLLNGRVLFFLFISYEIKPQLPHLKRNYVENVDRHVRYKHLEGFCMLARNNTRLQTQHIADGKYLMARCS